MKKISLAVLIFSISILINMPLMAQQNQASKILNERNIPVTKEQLWESAKNGDTKTVRLLLQAGINPNYGLGKYGESPILNATIMGHLAAVKLLVKYGAKIDTSYSKKYVATPLWYAVNNGDTDIVRYLLNKGANPLKKDRLGWSPMRQAKLYNETEIINLLEKAIKIRTKNAQSK